MPCCMGPTLRAGEPAAERSDPNYRDVVLEGSLRASALARLNPDLPTDATEKIPTLILALERILGERPVT